MKMKILADFHMCISVNKFNKFLTEIGAKPAEEIETFSKTCEVYPQNWHFIS